MSGKYLLDTNIVIADPYVQKHIAKAGKQSVGWLDTAFSLSRHGDGCAFPGKNTIQRNSYLLFNNLVFHSCYLWFLFAVLTFSFLYCRQLYTRERRPQLKNKAGNQQIKKCAISWRLLCVALSMLFIVKESISFHNA